MRRTVLQLMQSDRNYRGCLEGEGNAGIKHFSDTPLLRESAHFQEDSSD